MVIIELSELLTEEADAIFHLPYGKTTIPLSVPDTLSMDTITYRTDKEDASLLTSQTRIAQALSQPIGTPRLSELADGRHSAVIMVSDGTRLCPSHLLLPPLLQELNQAGIPDEAIDIIIALGMHRKHTPEEMQQLVGAAVYGRIRVHNHSAASEDCILLGTSQSGTPIEINRLAVKADLKIATGNIEPHALVGISGGIKALIPGIASQRCIEHNHSLSQHYKAVPGEPDNPIHRDMEEALRFLSVDFLLNVVVNHEKHVLEAAAGHVLSAHKMLISRASSRFLVPVQHVYDMTVVSPGGHPKDLQLYQAIKALRNASMLTKTGGTIIMAAECSEMLGNGVFQFWVETMKDRQRMVEKLKQQFHLGAHKILHLDEVLSKQRVYLYSTIPRPIVGLLGLLHTDDIQQVFDDFTSTTGKTVALMPYGSLTYPQLP
ncbi:nickel-dependent lactate racemase [Paenibacillus sp. UNC451MF]|uniref:nickel-dependent lactate racemase n=1 Tax=Paenibacillus sp. UNC451MF TaxID=1449063 RepID=UPI001E456701|nr:nickel-dependent lactate racemase [Paenibacillus sp. UNC451MF]